MFDMIIHFEFNNYVAGYCVNFSIMRIDLLS